MGKDTCNYIKMMPTVRRVSKDAGEMNQRLKWRKAWKEWGPCEMRCSVGYKPKHIYHNSNQEGWDRR